MGGAQRLLPTCLLLLLPLLPHGQLIGLTLCSGDGCKRDCYEVTVSSSACTKCNPMAGQCGNRNPSFIYTASGLSMYKDAGCSLPWDYDRLGADSSPILQEMSPFAVKVGDGCRPLMRNATAPYAVLHSVKAVNVSSILGCVGGWGRRGQRATCACGGSRPAQRAAGRARDWRRRVGAHSCLPFPVAVHSASSSSSLALLDTAPQLTRPLLPSPTAACSLLSSCSACAPSAPAAAAATA